jgi:hypothetical protein
MAPVYKVVVSNSSGIVQSFVTSYFDATISRQVNTYDLFTMSMNAKNPNAAPLVQGAIVSVSRVDKQLGVPEQIEFVGFVRRIDTVYESQTRIAVTCVGMPALLADRIVAYKANVANRSTFAAQRAETIAKNLVNFNIGTNATTANGRVLTGTVTGFATSASAGTGNVLTMSCSMRNLLTALQEVAMLGGGDFDVTYTPPASYTFVWYDGQRGTNRAATVSLSINNGAIAQTTRTDNRMDDFSAVIVGGPGTEAARVFYRRPASLPTGTALRETFINATNQQNATAAYFNHVGDSALTMQARKRVAYDSTVIQNGAFRYGRDYFLGDLVSVNVEGVNITQKVQGVTMSFLDTGEEEVNVSLITP